MKLDESKKIGFGYTLFLIVGSIVGSMAWLIYSPMIAKSSTIDCIVSFPVAALMILPLAFCVAELSSIFPRAGGPYIYIKEMFDLLPKNPGRLLGFLGGWTYWMAFVLGASLMLNGLADLCQRYFASIIQTNNYWFGPLVICMVLGLTTLANYFPIKNIAQINLLLTVSKLLILASFLALCLPNFTNQSEALFKSAYPSNQFSLTGVFNILVFSLGCFAGIEGSGCVASETKDAARTIPKVIFSAVLILVSFFTLTAIAIGYGSSKYVATASNTRALIENTNFEATVPDVANYLFGAGAGVFFNFAVIFSICACALPAFLYGARVLYSVANETVGQDSWLSQLHKTTLVPANAVSLQFVAMFTLSISLCLLQQFGIVPNAFSFLGESFGFIYGVLCVQYAIALITMRLKRPEIKRPFKIWGKGNGLAFILASFVILTFSYVALFTIGIEKQLVALGLILAGIPIYFASQNLLSQK